MPPPALPEFPFGAVLPITIAGIVGLGYVVDRRRRLNRGRLALGVAASSSGLYEVERS